MGAKFKMKIKHTGASSFDTYVGNDGKVITEKIKGAVEETAYNAVGKMVAEKTEEATRRNVFLSAMFFQRVVSRTPLDEDYITGMNKDGHLTMHKADDDVVRDCWVASYRNRKITSKELRENFGCEFYKFNDRKEVKKIYEQFLKLIGKTQNIRSIRIENTNERFAMLEYGEYEHDGTIKKDTDNKYYHGVKGGYSIQAPAGMLRLTEQEFQDTVFNIPTKDLMFDSKKWQRGLKKSGSIKTIKKVIQGSSKLSFLKCCEIAREYL